MRRKRERDERAPSALVDQIQVLVMSQHEAVRQQLVIYLGRAPTLAVSGDAFSPDAIVQANPDVLVLDLSQLGQDHLHQALAAVQRTRARLIALASIYEPAAERAIADAGGLYRLKSAGADGLAEIVCEVAGRPPAQAMPRLCLATTRAGDAQR